MKKTIRILVLCMAAVMFVTSFASCGAKTSENAVTVSIKISAGDTVIFDDEVTVNSDEPTVMQAFQQAMDDDNDFPIVVFDDEENPMTVYDVGEFKDSTEKFWEFRVNDIAFSDIKGQAGVYSIKEGDKIYWEYGAGSVDTSDDTAAE